MSRRLAAFQVARAQLPQSRSSGRVYQAPPSRELHARQVRNRVAQERQARARQITLAEFESHRGTRVATSFLKSPELPRRRKRP
jgi:hypothetical protein